MKHNEAEEFAAAMEDDVRRGSYADPSDSERLFASVSELWIKTEVDAKASTVNRYKDELRCYVYPK